MEPDFKVKVDGLQQEDRHRHLRAEILEHTPENVRRLVVCQKELKLGDRGAYKMRDHEQAAKDLDVLKAAMAACENCKYGLWTNGLEFFFFRVERTRFDVKFKPIGDWPLSDESHRDTRRRVARQVAAPEIKSLNEVAGLTGCGGVKFRRREALCVERRGLGDEARGTVWAGRYARSGLRGSVGERRRVVSASTLGRWQMHVVLGATGLPASRPPARPKLDPFVG